jgi:hypothetical protein
VTRPNRWRDDLERSMPPTSDPVARNRAITARYARWYLQEPRFKWTAMASFASAQAGDVLALRYGGSRRGRAAAKTASAATKLPGFVKHAQHALARAKDKILGDAIELIRETNAAVFDDVGWAHHAFLATGDAAAVVAQLDGDESHRDVARGFVEIANARELERTDPAAARFAMWEGNRLLLRHEQIATVQPRFAKIPWAFRAQLTLFAVTPYEALADAPVRNTRFLPFALRRLASSRKRADLPSMMDLDQRWGWIDRECFPLFREAEERGDPRMRAVMERFAALAPAVA